MMDTTASATGETPLEREHLFHLLMARNWLAIGSLEEARREFDLLPPEAQRHPQARELLLRLHPDVTFGPPKK